jgi:outer membrane receptor for ferrienterochelin and colicins
MQYKLFLSFIFIFSFSNYTFSQTYKDSTPINDTIPKDTTIVLEETTIKTSRYKIGEITNLSRQEITTQNSLFEAINVINGVQSQYTCNVCGTGEIRINGIEGPYTMVTIDDMPIVSGLGSVYGLMGIPTAMMQEIEVLKGPAGVFYGSESVAGNINIKTRDIEKAPKFSIDLRTSTWLENNLDIGKTLKIGKVNSLFGLNFYDFSQRIDKNNDNFTDMPLQQRFSFFNKWQFKRKENRKAGIIGRFLQENRFGGEIQWQKKDLGSENYYGEKIFTERYELLGVYQLPISNENILLQTSFNHHFQSSYYGTTFYRAFQQILFAQLLWHKKINQNHQFKIGLPFRSNVYADNTPATNGIQQRRNLWGTFIEYQSNFKNWQILAGARYDYDSIHGSIFTPRLKITKDFQNHTLSFTTGTGFRVVNVFTEDHAALTDARKVIFKDALRPEKSLNFNISHTYSFKLWNGVWNLNNNFFYNYFSNKITPDYSEIGLIIYQNLNGFAVARGANIDLDANFGNWNFEIGGTFLNNFWENTENNITRRQAIFYTPNFSANYKIKYNWLKYNLEFQVNGRTMGNMTLPTQPNDFRSSQSPVYTLLDFQFTKKLKNKWEIYGGVRNLLNFLPQNPIARSFDPFDRNVSFDNEGNPIATPDNPNAMIFDPSYNYAPMQGIRGFLGVRWEF